MNESNDRCRNLNYATITCATIIYGAIISNVRIRYYTSPLCKAGLDSPIILFRHNGGSPTPIGTVVMFEGF